MPGLNPLVTAVAATAAALLASTWWFGVHRRRKAEMAAGIQALAGMKWRECVGLVLQALAEKGFKEAPSSRQPGDGGTEFVLTKGDERCLLSYKHGTAYRLGEASVRDFANGVQLQGASRGILVTLGSAEGFARDLARRYDVDLIDGPGLWPQVEPFVPVGLVDGIRGKAARDTRRGQQLGLAGSLLLGVLVYFAASLGQPARAPAPASVVPASAPPMEPAAPATRTTPKDAATLQAEATRRALEEVANLSEEQRAQRRVTAAARVAALDEAESAIWSTQSTLAIGMVDAEGIDSGLVNEACAILTEYEEMRYSRLQLDPPAGSGAPVRWRQCQ